MVQGNERQIVTLNGSSQRQLASTSGTIHPGGLTATEHLSERTNVMPPATQGCCLRHGGAAEASLPGSMYFACSALLSAWFQKRRGPRRPSRLTPSLYPRLSAPLTA